MLRLDVHTVRQGVAMVVERIAEALLVVIALRAGIRVAASARRGGSTRGLGLEGEIRTLVVKPRMPITAIVITGLLVAGALTQVLVPGAFDALRNDAGGGWWRAFTAAFVQDGGVLGAIFNIVTAAVVLTLAEWYWGHLLAAGVWLLGAWAPVGELAGLVGYHVASTDVSAYSAGSSGATYFAAATLSAALVLGGTGRERLLGLIAPAFALVLWVVLDDGHGVLFVEGGMLGALLWCVVRLPASPPLRPGRRRPDEGVLTSFGRTSSGGQARQVASATFAGRLPAS